MTILSNYKKISALLFLFSCSGVYAMENDPDKIFLKVAEEIDKKLDRIHWLEEYAKYEKTTRGQYAFHHDAVTTMVPMESQNEISLTPQEQTKKIIYIHRLVGLEQCTALAMILYRKSGVKQVIMSNYSLFGMVEQKENLNNALKNCNNSDDEITAKHCIILAAAYYEGKNSNEKLVMRPLPETLNHIEELQAIANIKEAEVSYYDEYYYNGKLSYFPDFSIILSPEEIIWQSCADAHALHQIENT